MQLTNENYKEEIRIPCIAIYLFVGDGYAQDERWNAELKGKHYEVADSSEMAIKQVFRLEIIMCESAAIIITRKLIHCRRFGL